MNDNFVIDIAWQDRHVRYELEPEPGSIIDMNLAGCLRTQGCCEPEVMYLMFRALREGDACVDGGANIGVFTVLMAQLVGKNGLVWAFEPSLDNYTRLLANCKLSGLLEDAIELRKMPLWSEKKKLEFVHDIDPGQSSLIGSPHPQQKEILQTGTLNDVGGPLRLIKLDVEGAEEWALRGGRKHLGECPFIVCELNEAALVTKGSSQHSLRSWMYSFGYDTFLLHKDGSYPSRLPLDVPIKMPMLNCNVLFSTGEEVVKIWPETVIT